DVLSFATIGPSSGVYTAGTGVLTLSGTDTLANYQAALRTVKYTNSSDNPSTLARTVTWVGNDGAAVNNLSAGVTSTINLTAVNDAPVATAGNTLAYAHIQAASSIDTTITAPDDNGVNGCTATPFSLASVTVNSCAGCVISNINAAAGSFDFEPPAGQTGPFTLNYTVSDNGCPGTATSAATAINITVAGPVIWFVDGAAAPAGNGTLAHPFQTLAAADAVDAVNQGIFVASGTYTNGIALNSGETMIGQGCNPCTFDAIFAISPPAGTMTRPTLNGTSPILQGTVTAGSSSFVRG